MNDDLKKMNFWNRRLDVKLPRSALAVLRPNRTSKEKSSSSLSGMFECMSCSCSGECSSCSGE